jgi:glycosyltransferase involved in cell wall biosynthesis
MRLLFLSFAFPLPANNGHRMRTWSILEALAAVGHDLTLLTFGQPGEAGGYDVALRKVCREIEIVPLILESLSSTANYLERLVGLFLAQPYAVRRFASSEMQARIRQFLARGSFDAVLCDTVFSSVNLSDTHVPVILNCHNVEHVVLERYVALERNPVKRLYAWREISKLRNWEEATCRQAAIAMACSEHDQELLSSLCPGLRVTVVPNVVDVDRYAPQRENNSSTILFQGAMDWFPNRDAVTFFVARILPALKQNVPHIRFVVAGRNPPPTFVSTFADVSGIEFTGNVPDMRAEIAKAAVCIVPLRIGSGTRLKILEAAAMAKPIVSTRVGAEGLDFADGEEIVLADEPSEFTRAILDLLADPLRRRAMGLAARRRVEIQYSLPALRSALGQALAQLPAKSPDVVPAAEPRRVEARARALLGARRNELRP